MPSAQPPYARLAPNATKSEIAANWDVSNRPAPKWSRLSADEQRMIIRNTRHPGANGSAPLPLRSEQTHNEHAQEHTQG